MRQMRRIVSAALSGVLLAILATGVAAAAKPDRVVIDISQPGWPEDIEAILLAECGFPIDIEGTGHIIVHVFNDHPRMVEIDNYRLFETFSANGKTITVRPDAGPDRYWVGTDGHLYLALTGRSVTGSGVIGRTVIDLTTGETISSRGNEVGDFLTRLCTELAPED